MPATGNASTTDSEGGATDDVGVSTVVGVDAGGTDDDIGTSVEVGASVDVGASVVVVVGGGADTVKVYVCTAARYAPLSAMSLIV